jgi:hypothetical protein
MAMGHLTKERWTVRVTCHVLHPVLGITLLITLITPKSLCYNPVVEKWRPVWVVFLVRHVASGIGDLWEGLMMPLPSDPFVQERWTSFFVVGHADVGVILGMSYVMGLWCCVASGVLARFAMKTGIDTAVIEILILSYLWFHSPSHT